MDKTLMYEYINSVAKTEASQRSLIDLLNVFHSYMDKYHHGDVSKISEDVIKDFFKKRRCVDLQSARGNLLTLGRYLKYLNLPDFTVELTASDLVLEERYKNGFFATYEDIYTLISQYRSVEDGYNIHPYAIFAWMGVPVSRVGDFQASDIHLDNKTIEVDNIGIRRLDDLMVSVLKRYLKPHTHKRGNGKIYVPAFRNAKFLYKMIPKQEPDTSLEITRNEVDNAFRDIRVQIAPRKFSYKDVAMSGNLNRMYQLEQSGIDVYDIKNFKLIKNAFGLNEKSQKRHKDLVVQYDLYKKAFDLK